MQEFEQLKSIMPGVGRLLGVRRLVGALARCDLSQLSLTEQERFEIRLGSNARLRRQTAAGQSADKEAHSKEAHSKEVELSVAKLFPDQRISGPASSDRNPERSRLALVNRRRLRGAAPGRDHTSHA